MRRGARTIIAVGFVLALASDVVIAQEAMLSVPPAGAQHESDAPEIEKWELSASVYTFLVPHDHDYASPNLKADRGWLHLEARYNYEATETGSFFAGYNFHASGDVDVNATAMLGAVFGDTAGVAPGYEVSFGYKSFELYSEGEYLIDTRDTSDSFFYSWSELTYSPADWIRFGLVAQRTRAYHTDLDIQRGILLGLTWRHFDFTTYLFNVGWDDALLVFALGWSG